MFSDEMSSTDQNITRIKAALAALTRIVRLNVLGLAARARAEKALTLMRVLFWPAEFFATDHFRLVRITLVFTYNSFPY